MLKTATGPKVRGFGQHATLLGGGCKIQSEMDTIGCHWQDILLSHYIHASRVTVWPTVNLCLENPKYLENEWFSSFNSVINDMDMVITLLMSGVKEMSRKCGSRSANRLRVLLQKIHHLQRDAHKCADLIFNVMTAEQAWLICALIR